MKRFTILLLAASMLSCGGATEKKSTTDEIATEGTAKYIFYFIGDGMAATQVRLAEAALSVPEFRTNFCALSGAESIGAELNIKALDQTGLATSNAENRYITDSAAAGTALATGSKTNVGVIGQDSEGNDLISVAAKAKQSGMKVGIISSVSIDHATPASFYAHTPSRNNYSTISDQLIASGFDYFAGGSVKFDARAKAEGTDKATAYASYRAKAQEHGYTMTSTRQELEALKKSENQKVIATIDMLASKQFANDGFSLPYTIDLDQNVDDDRISLADFTRKGIELLDNPNGFFMMVEGGKIDWACHANDAATCAYEVVAFDQAIQEAVAFAKLHPAETLIVVTGDHDCGGLTIGFSGTGYESAFELLANSKTSYAKFAEMAKSKINAGAKFEELLSLACDNFGFTTNEKASTSKHISQTRELSDVEIDMLREGYTKSATKKISDRDTYLNAYGGYDPFTTTCTNILNNKAGVEFASYSHTAVPVMVFAGGTNAQLFSGYYDNTDIAKRILTVAGLQ